MVCRFGWSIYDTDSKGGGLRPDLRVPAFAGMKGGGGLIWRGGAGRGLELECYWGTAGATRFESCSRTPRQCSRICSRSSRLNRRSWWNLREVFSPAEAT